MLNTLEFLLSPSRARVQGGVTRARPRAWGWDGGGRCVWLVQLQVRVCRVAFHLVREPQPCPSCHGFSVLMAITTWSRRAGWLRMRLRRERQGR